MRRAREGLPRRKWLLRCCEPWRKWANQWDRWQLRRCAGIRPSPWNKLPSTSRNNEDESLSRAASARLLLNLGSLESNTVDFLDSRIRGFSIKMNDSAMYNIRRFALYFFLVNSFFLLFPYWDYLSCVLVM